MDVSGIRSRRDLILAAAEREFASRGFAAARVDAIAAAAGVNKQLLFHYFGSKAGLHEAATAAALARFRMPGPSAAQPSERLRQLIKLLQAAASEFPALLWLAVGIPSLAESQSAQAMATAWFGSAVAAAQAILEDAQRSGHLRDDIDSKPIAELVVTASLAAAPKEQPERSREALVRLVMDACGWR